MSDTVFIEGRMHWGWYRPKTDGGVDLHIRAPAMSEEVWDEAIALTRVSGDSRPSLLNYLALIEDFKVLETLEQKMAERIASVAKDTATIIPTGYREIMDAQRFVSHFLASAGAFRERTRARLIRTCGRKSDVVSSWEQLTQAMTANSFAFRFVWALRNHSLHYDVPISHVPMNARRDEGGLLEFDVAIEMRPSALLENGGFDRDIAKELKSLESSTLDLSSIIRDAMKSHAILMRHFLRAFERQILEMLAYGRMLYERLEVPEGAVLTIWNIEDPSKQPENITMVDPGFGEGLQLASLLEKLNRIENDATPTSATEYAVTPLSNRSG